MTDPAVRKPLPMSLGRRAARWAVAFWPAPQSVNARERLRVVLGAGLGLLATALLSQWIRVDAGVSLPWLVAPLGASAVLVFGVPASPLAQPWAVVGGNTLSALVGVLCVWLLGSNAGAAALAVALAIALMFALRCLHPPGGASALLVALSGMADPHFVLFPIFTNSLLLVLAGVIYNTLTRRSYPHQPLQPAAAPADAAPREPGAPLDDLDADLNAVLARYNQVLDISRDDLRALLEDTHLQTYQRRLANIRCADIMSRRLITVRQDAPLEQGWALFREHRIKALPVVDAGGGLVGIVTPADFMRHAAAGGDAAAVAAATTGTVSPARKVGDLMSRQVRVASASRHLAELIPLFASTGHHHLPILSAEGHLVGIVTQSDVVAALSRADAPV